MRVFFPPLLGLNTFWMKKTNKTHKQFIPMRCWGFYPYVNPHGNSLGGVVGSTHMETHMGIPLTGTARAFTTRNRPEYFAKTKNVAWYLVWVSLLQSDFSNSSAIKQISLGGWTIAYLWCWPKAKKSWPLACNDSSLGKNQEANKNKAWLWGILCNSLVHKYSVSRKCLSQVHKYSMPGKKLCPLFINMPC